MPTPLKPYWQTTDKETFRIYHGDVIETLKRMPAKSVHCVVTSPPYWNLRDYGTGQWEGGSKDCDHVEKTINGMVKGSTLNVSKDRTKSQTFLAHQQMYDENCGKCGAVRVDRQIGREKSPDCLGWARDEPCGECFVCHMVEVFAEVHRVLRDDGVLWLNLGDSYAKPVKGRKQSKKNQKNRLHRENGLKTGDLVGVPWRVALALQWYGWTLRQDVIWAKPDPMPESVKNRCTKAHEYLFMFTKSERYFFDHYAIREKSNTEPGASYEERVKAGKGSVDWKQDKRTATHGDDSAGTNLTDPTGFANKRDVWNVATNTYKGAHFATFPFDLINPCIKSSTSEYGCCTKCKAPFKKVVERSRIRRHRPNEYTKYKGEKGTGNSCDNTVSGVLAKSLGWYPTCDCAGLPEIPGETKETAKWLDKVLDLCLKASKLRVEPCVVMDPFSGSATTLEAAFNLGRYGVGIELNEKYIVQNAIPRLVGALHSAPAYAHLAGMRKETQYFGEPM